MRETGNKYFSYPGIEYWDMKEDRVTLPAIPLTTKVSELNTKLYTVQAKPENERRSDGYYNPKAFCYIHDDMLELLKSKGLTFYCSAMMEMIYIAIVPEKHMKENKRYDDDMDTLIVMKHVDISDPNYAMYALDQHMDYIDMAAREGIALHFGLYSKWDNSGRILVTLRESLVIHRFNYNRLFLDVSGILKAGEKLSDIPGLAVPGYANPDDAIEKIGSLGIPAVNIAKMWISDKRSIGMQSSGRNHNMDFNPEHFVHSVMGRRRAAGVEFFKEFNDVRDPALTQKLYDIGVDFSVRETEGEQWLCFVPRQAVEEGRKVPVVGYFGEVNAFDPPHAVGTVSGCYAFIDHVAQGDFALVIFALEDPDSNDLMEPIIRDAAELYPIDLSRVYITGHSHNGRFTAEFTRRHQRFVAAASPLGNEPGQLSPEWTSGYFAVSDEQLLQQASVDTPILMQCGFNEINCMFPLYTDAPFPNPATPFIPLDKKEKRIKSWQRRLISMNCPMKTEEEIYATEHSTDYVERMTGIPADRTEILYIDGTEIFCADIKNNNGDYHFRVCGYYNTPHAAVPIMADMMWNFCRRFARDQETGETIELYTFK